MARVRSGEGVPIAVSRRPAILPNGSSGFEISLDLSAAPVPDRVYVADRASVVLSDTFVCLLLGQARVVGKGLRSLVVIRMAPEAVLQHLGTCEEFVPSLRESLKSLGQPPAELITLEEEPAQTVSLVASIIASAFSGREACADFYHTSPWALRELNSVNQRDILIDPVVRVNLPSALLLAILDHLIANREALYRQPRLERP